MERVNITGISTNLIFYPLDLLIMDFCNEINLYYSRFVDDIAISGNYDFKDKTDDILQLIQKEPYNINHSKTLYRTGKTEITGIIVSNNVLNPKELIELKIRDQSLNPATLESLKQYKKRVKKA